MKIDLEGGLFSKNKCGNTKKYVHLIALTTEKERLQKRIFIS